jgi:hypothetical protein
MDEICGFIPGVGLSDEECRRLAREKTAHKVVEEEVFDCSKGHGKRRVERWHYVDCLTEDGSCEWRLDGKCIACGMNPKDPGGKEGFKVVPKMLEDLRGILNFLPEP